MSEGVWVCWGHGLNALVPASRASLPEFGTLHPRLGAPAAIDVAGGRYAAVATTRAQPCPAGGWAQARLRLQGYPAGCRRATVVLKGMGGSAVVSENVGVFGAKFAAPTLRLLPEDEV